MPDVSRSDSQRSDSSQRPRVSFNRDVHVKRIGHPGTPRVVDALAGDGEGNLVPLTVRRERPTRLSRRELAKEAQKVLEQAGSVQCSSKSLGENKNGFNTLPPIRSNHKHRRTNQTQLHARISQESPTSSLDRRTKPRKAVPVISTLERERRKKGSWSDQELERSLNRNRNSSSLNDLLDNSSSSQDHSRKPRKPLSRSRSESGDRLSPLKRSKSGTKKSGFLSLDRLTLKRNKNKAANKSHSDHSDRSPRPRKHILRKTYSDSESSSLLAVPEHVLVEAGRNKKQLSPIIEVPPRQDYFKSRKPGILKDDHTTSMHSSQVTPRPPLTRGQTVDQMVKRLSQDSKLRSGPPRGISSPTVVVAPGEERRHNNNLPFSYTEPTPAQSGRETLTPTSDKLPCTSSVTPTSPDGQVIYAEVVVSGGGGNGGALNKQTVHTKVSANKQCNAQPSLEDEGLGSTMERRKTNYSAQQTRSYGKRSLGVDDLDRNYSKDMNGYRARDYVENDGFSKSRVNSRIKNDSDKSYIQESSSKVVRDVRVDYGNGLDGNSSRKYVTQESSRFHSGGLDSSGRGRADGMDSRKKELEGYAKYEFGEKESSRRNLMDSFTRSENYKTEHRSDSRVATDDVDGSAYYDRQDPAIIQSRIDSHDLSSRRDRLESRIESQRKDRLNNSRINDSFKYNNGDSKIVENKKYPSDIPRMNSDTAYSNRRDFLYSQLDYDKDLIKEEERYENQRGYVTSNRYVESITTEVDSYNKKDILADSGIEIDYRKDSTGMRGSFNKYDDVRQMKPKDGLTAKISVNSNHHQQPHNVTRVDVNRHARENLSDNDEELDESIRYRYSSNTKHGDSFVSTRLVQEQKRTVEAIPASTVLIRHYAPSSKDQHRARNTDERDSDEEYQHEKNERGWKQDDREERVDNRKEKRKDEDGDKGSDDKNKKTEAKKTTKKKQVSTMDKMRQLFSRSDSKTLKKNKKKEEKKIKEEAKLREQNKEPEEDALTSRYTEYKGSNVDVDKVSELRNNTGGNLNLDRSAQKPQHRNEAADQYNETTRSHHRSYQINLNDQLEVPRTHHRSYAADDGSNTPRSHNRSSYQTRQASDAEDRKESKPEEFIRTRQRLATPTPSPNPPRAQHTTATLNRLNNSKNKENSGGNWFKSLDRLTKRNKNKAKIENIMEVTTEDEIKPVKQNINNNNNNNNTNKNLRFFGDTDQESVASTRQRRYKSNSNKLQVPTRHAGGGLRNNHRHHRSVGDVATSSAESTTEGDSSQQSQKSVVYLHAATVGDIPGPVRSRSVVGRRAQSREELSSAGSSHLQPQTKTVSRSISMLAPWKPRHHKEGTEVHYDNDKGKPPKVPTSHVSGSSTVNRATRRRNAEKEKGKSASVESLSHINSRSTPKKQSTVNLSTSIESLSHMNGVKHQQKKDGRNTSKKNSVMNASAIELNSNKSYKLAGQKKTETSKKSSSKLSRSASMPKDSRVTSGWFKLRSKKQVA